MSDEQPNIIPIQPLDDGSSDNNNPGITRSGSTAKQENIPENVVDQTVSGPEDSGPHPVAENISVEDQGAKLQEPPVVDSGTASDEGKDVPVSQVLEGGSALSEEVSEDGTVAPHFLDTVSEEDPAAGDGGSSFQAQNPYVPADGEGAVGAPAATTTSKNKPSRRIFSFMPNRTLYVFLLISFVVIGLGSSLVYLYNNSSLQPGAVEPLPTENPETPVVIETPSKPDPDWKTYVNREYEFQIDYPKETLFKLPSDMAAQSVTYTITYAGEKQDEAITTATDISDGYLVKITMYKNVLNTDLAQIALNKRSGYLSLCPATAEYGDIKDAVISGEPAKTFVVDNCNVNYVETFLIKGSNMYEIAQAYRGDVGFKQRYQAQTDLIREAFKFTNIIAPEPKDTWTKIVHGNPELAVSYPSDWDDTCCNLRGPIAGEVTKYFVAVDPLSIGEDDQAVFNGLAAYSLTLKNDETYESFMAEQKELLKEEYRVVVGIEPEVSDETFEVNGFVWTHLTNYAWWGEIYFSYISDSNRVVVLVKSEEVPGKLDEVFSELLETVSYKFPQNQ
ncbi:hypothetical protein H6802_00250 [Candidatus Nomurabacteria bacterium]|uniref:Uncharacterized protein n=1 Tax=candidate division WWE3 bacterium TaxID=2053526 RepID=A0A955IWT0_UNCKA|nr:hypothetical protein [candidate division WWE3 bacterium]MCB9823383.1 hypothetical protein [Candidatus Nomurabacteria bacterium]MCB9826724.1 hypothetical protein [Candidatus Nomurabacteria bacterium]MCB9827665.1 hypothetical protein [Candidatus Nomurabacteria bacterium]HXK52544.1 hypothetical protein [bacterium]